MRMVLGLSLLCAGCTCREVRIVEVKDRTIVVDASLSPVTDARRVVVLVSDPSGEVSSWWTADQLPVEAEVDDDDLVTFAFIDGAYSNARSFRVAPDVSEVRLEIDAYPWDFDRRCAYQEPMTLELTVPSVEGAEEYTLLSSRSIAAVDSSLKIPGPGTHTYTIEGCSGTESFDVMVVASANAVDGGLAFARVDGLPYVPGSAVEVPIAFSDERSVVEVTAFGAPGTEVQVAGVWSDSTLKGSANKPLLGIAEIGSNGEAELSASPLVFAGGRSWLEVSAPLRDCERDIAVKYPPFNDAPWQVVLGSLAAPLMQQDGAIAIESTGERGDVLVRNEFDSLGSANWQLHEDPERPLPLPAKPQIPVTALPEFVWPRPNAEDEDEGRVSYQHWDVSAVGGYAEFTRTLEKDQIARLRDLSSMYCD